MSDGEPKKQHRVVGGIALLIDPSAHQATRRRAFGKMGLRS